MDRELGKKKRKATESAPMFTKQKDDGLVKNQTTEVPVVRFPWTTIVIILAFVIFIAVIIAFLEVGSKVS